MPNGVILPNGPAQAGRGNSVGFQTDARPRPCLQPDGWALCMSSAVSLLRPLLLRLHPIEFLMPLAVLMVAVEAADKRRNNCPTPIQAAATRDACSRNNRARKSTKTVRWSAKNAKPSVQARYEKHNVAESCENKYGAPHCAASAPGRRGRLTRPSPPKNRA